MSPPASDRGRRSTADLALLLDTEFLVAVDRNGTVQVPRINGLLVVPLFATYDDLPNTVPPGCARYDKRLGHQLLAELSAQTALYLHPSTEMVSLAELLAPARALLEAARGRDQDAVTTAFADAIIYCPADAEQALPAREDGSIAVFSTLRALTHGLGPTRWFATAGGELRSLLPSGSVLVLDPLSPHETTVVTDRTSLTASWPKRAGSVDASERSV